MGRAWSVYCCKIYVLGDRFCLQWAGKAYKKVLDSCRKKVNHLHSVISNRDINMSAPRLLLLSEVRPSLSMGVRVSKKFEEGLNT